MALEYGQFRENFRPISERDTPLKGIPAGSHGIALIRGVIRRKHEISDRNSGNKRARFCLYSSWLNGEFCQGIAVTLFLDNLVRPV